MNLSLLDVSSLAVDRLERPATFAVILRSTRSSERWNLERLREGARIAMREFPRSACCVDGTEWIVGSTEPEITELTVADLEEQQREAESFVSGVITPTHAPLLRQRLIRERKSGSVLLATQMHHALGDGIALVLWLSCQMRGTPVLGSRRKLSNPSGGDGLRLRQAAQPNGKKPKWKMTQSLCRPMARSTRSAQKCWKTLFLDENELRAVITGRKLGITLNDLGCAIIFRSLREWLGTTSRPLSLWMPLSLRRDPFSGFGNASSRIRVLEPQGDGTWIDYAKQVRAQIEHALGSGQWDLGRSADPIKKTARWVGRIQARVLRLLLKMFFARPGMDPCTTAFSFGSRVSAIDDAEAFPDVETLETVGHLYSAHPFAFSAGGFGGRMAITFFWDPAQLEPTEACRLFELLSDASQAALKELQ